MKTIIKIMMSIIILLIILIVLKSNESLKTSFYKNVYETNINFAEVNKIYKKYLGNILPFENLINIEPVFNETLKYSEANIYKDGVNLTVELNYMVPSIEEGLVIYIGKKEEYGNTVIVQQINGIDVWYSNLSITNVKMYDYIEKGSLIGEANNNLYLVFTKDGKYLDYKKYL